MLRPLRSADWKQGYAAARRCVREAAVEGRQVRGQPFCDRQMQGVTRPQGPGTVHQQGRSAEVGGLDLRYAQGGRREALEEGEGLSAGRAVDHPSAP